MGEREPKPRRKMRKKVPCASSSEKPNTLQLGPWSLDVSGNPQQEKIEPGSRCQLIGRTVKVRT